MCSHPTTCPHTPWPCNNSCSNSCLNPCRSPCLSPCFNHVSVGNVLLVHYTQSHRTRQLFLPQTYIYNQRCLELPILLATSAMLASLSRHARLKVNKCPSAPPQNDNRQKGDKKVVPSDSRSASRHELITLTPIVIPCQQILIRIPIALCFDVLANGSERFPRSQVLGTVQNGSGTVHELSVRLHKKILRTCERFRTVHWKRSFAQLLSGQIKPN